MHYVLIPCIQPDSAGVQCIILAGCLGASNPAKFRPISVLRRLQVKDGGRDGMMGGVG